MAVIKYRVKARGRPRELDTELVYKNIIEKSEKASQRLAQFRRETKGVRGERILGSSTSLPDIVEEALDILEAEEYGREIGAQEIQQIIKAQKIMKELSSPQSRVYQRALEDVITSNYISDLQREYGEGSRFTQKTIRELETLLTSMTPQQRQGFFLSSSYESIQKAHRYKRIKSWAEADAGRKMSYQEAWVYLFKRRLEDYGETN